MRSLTIGLVLIPLHALLPAVSDAQCPETCVSLSWVQPFCSTAAAFDTTRSHIECYEQISYRLADGTLSATVGGGFANCWGIVDAQDTFIISWIGPEPTQDVTVELYVHVEGYGASAGGATLQVNKGEVAEWINKWNCYLCEDTEADSTLSITTTVQNGGELSLKYSVVGSAGESSVTAQARLGFSRLPAGTTVQSCQGFVFDYTQTQATTWGRVKGIYR